MFYLKRFSVLFLFFVFVFSSAPAKAREDSSFNGAKSEDLYGALLDYSLRKGSFDGGKFDGFYGGIDAAFVSNKAKGTVGPLMVRVSVPMGTTMNTRQGPFPFGGTDKLAGGSVFAGYGMTLSRFFVALEIAGSYGSYNNSKAFNSPNFTSNIDITQGFFGTTGRLGFLLKENLMVYSNIGWARSWVEAGGTVSTIALPSFPGRRLPLNQSVNTDVTFDGVSFGCGFEYAFGEKGVIRARLAYTRIEQGKERFSYDAAGLSGRPLVMMPVTVSIQQDQIPAEADASANVFSFGLLYSL